MTDIGYARVSTRDQSDDSQVDELLAVGCDPDRLFIDHGVSGKLASRPELDACLTYLRKGDVLVVTRGSKGDLRAVAGAEDHGQGAARFEFGHAVIGVLEIGQPFDSNAHKYRGLGEGRP